MSPDPDGGSLGGRARRRRAARHGKGLLLGIAITLLVASVSSAAAVLWVTGSPGSLVSCRLGATPHRENRGPVALARMSRWLPLATVAIEDRRFWHHGALDPAGVARSALADLTSGRIVQGASTITEQLVRNRYLGGEHMTFPRKLSEACLAAALFRRWPRRRILEAYLNTVYYGHRARGVQAAARTYFSRPAARLSLARAALLAGLPQAPSADDPLRRPAAALARRAEVLAAMRRARDITRAQYRAALAAPIGLRPGARAPRPAAGPPVPSAPMPAPTVRAVQ